MMRTRFVPPTKYIYDRPAFRRYKKAVAPLESIQQRLIRDMFTATDTVALDDAMTIIERCLRKVDDEHEEAQADAMPVDPWENEDDVDI